MPDIWPNKGYLLNPDMGLLENYLNEENEIDKLKEENKHLTEMLISLCSNIDKHRDICVNDDENYLAFNDDLKCWWNVYLEKCNKEKDQLIEKALDKLTTQEKELLQEYWTAYNADNRR